jgi:hypothetical protein
LDTTLRAAKESNPAPEVWNFRCALRCDPKTYAAAEAASFCQYPRGGFSYAALSAVFDNGRV